MRSRNYRSILHAAEEPGEFEPGRSTEPAIVRKGYGDVDAAFRAAHAVVAATWRSGGIPACPWKPAAPLRATTRRATCLSFTAPRRCRIGIGTRSPGCWNGPPSSVHLYEGHVGGGFGIRGELYPEDVLVCAAALRMQRPIKWIEDRREHLVAANHSREQHHHVRAATDRDGRILALEDEIFHDQGAYMRTHAATVPDLAAAMLPGPYRIPAYRANAHIRLTNKTPCGTYRAPGRFESTFVRERLMDAIAAKLGLDPVEVRRRNLIASHEMPYERPLDTLGTDIVLDSGDYAGLLDKALAAVEWTRLRETLAARKAAGELVGAGVALFVEKSGLGPFDQVKIDVDADGMVEVISGAASVGQGMETVIAQICADALGVDYRKIRVTHGQTDRIEFGMGAFASRVTVMTGEATRIAAAALRPRRSRSRQNCCKRRRTCSTWWKAKSFAATRHRDRPSNWARLPARCRPTRRCVTAGRPVCRRRDGSIAIT